MNRFVHMHWKGVNLALGLLLLTVVPASATRFTHPVNACEANMRQLDGAVQQWALDHGKKSTNQCSATDPEILGYLKRGTLQCPSGGTYELTTVAESPRCSVHGSLGEAWDREHQRSTRVLRLREVVVSVIGLACSLLVVPWPSFSLKARTLLPSLMPWVFLFSTVPWALGIWPAGARFPGMTSSRLPELLFAGIGIGLCLRGFFMPRQGPRYGLIMCLIFTCLAVVLSLIIP
jgi:hypothetical protein